ncbi:MAG: hypothetical protein ABI852_12980, partial [Gemmatimonadaceae bacterium]
MTSGNSRSNSLREVPTLALRVGERKDSKNTRSAMSFVLIALAVFSTACTRNPSTAPIAAPEFTPSARQTALLDTIGQRTFQWFWDTTDPNTGLTP